MKIQTYTSTPGLDRYPEHDRFTVYRAAHKRLMREDAAYRRQWSSYIAGIVCVAVVPIGEFVAGGALGTVFSVLSLVGVVAGVIYLAFRQQRFMNQRIGDVLQHQVA
jgi:hypothetical protein